jgi:hypothetical protein
MAALYGANVTKIRAGGSGDNIVAGGQIKVTTKVFQDTYEAAAAQIADTIEIATLPADQTIVDVKIYFDALGAATVDVGDSDTANRYMDAVDVSAASDNSLDEIGGQNYVTGTNDGDTSIIITVIGAAITGTIKAVVTYTN